MLLKGLPRAQLLSSAWALRNVAFVRQLASKQSNSASNGPSLFEELFPNESKQEKSSAPIFGNYQGRVRRVGVPHKLEKHITPQTETPLLKPTQEPIAEDHYIQELEDASVLVLSNASKSLALSDFLRISPKGEHIDGWASGILRVIPGRDPTTLETQGHYFILFSNPTAAISYRDNLIRLHRISRLHTPTSIMSPLAPPPGYLKDGEDLHGLIQSFTLIPPSQYHVSIRMLQKPLSPAMQRIIAAGGYSAIVARRSKSEHLVLLSLDKGHVGIYDLRAAIGRDGKERNLQWNLLPGKEDIVKVDGGKVLAEEGEGAVELDLLQDLEERKRKRWQPPRFILSFKDSQEARRFVSAWHRRPFPLITAPQNLGDEGPPIVNAELLW